MVWTDVSKYSASGDAKYYCEWATHWENVFTPTDSGTKVNVIITYGSKEDMEKIISLGFKEGFSAANQNLDELFKKLQNDI